VEHDNAGAASHVEHHRAPGDRIRDLVAVGFVLRDLVEPECAARTRAGLGPVGPAARPRLPRHASSPASRSRLEQAGLPVR
jgi:hypothetical protein